VARLAERGGGQLARVGARGCRREAARRAPKVQRRSGRTHAAVSCGRIAPARCAVPHVHQVFPCQVALSRGEGRAIGARRAPRAFKDVVKVLTGGSATCFGDLLSDSD